MATFKAVVMTGKSHLKSDGTTNIKIRVYHNKEIQYISTPLYIEPQYMDKSGCISALSGTHEIMTYEINELMQNIRKQYLELGIDRTRFMTCRDLRDILVNSLDPEANRIDFVQFGYEVIRKTKRSATADWYQCSLNVLCWYMKSRRIDIRNITSSLLNKMMCDLYVSGPKGKPLEPGTVSNYFRAIRALYNKAKLYYNNEDYDIIKIPGNPFNKVEIPAYRRKRKNLSIDIITEIRDTTFPRGRTNMARDVFMMMFYMMGINVKDLFLLSSEKRGRIEYTRSKTNTGRNNNQFMLSIKIEPELRMLLDRYSKGSFLSFFHTKYGNADNFMKAVNIGLRDICRTLKIDAPITTNWARHSWASIARNKAGISKADIDFCLGHVNNDYKMADIYIDIDYTIYDHANRAVLDLLKKK